MLHRFTTILFLVVWCIFAMQQSEAQDSGSSSPASNVPASGNSDQQSTQQTSNVQQNSASAPASNVPASGKPTPKPERRSSQIGSLAQSISDGMKNSKVFGSFADFELSDPYDLFVRVASRFLAKAGINDPELAKIPAIGGADVGVVTAQLYFDTIGNTLAKFFFSKGLLETGGMKHMSQSFVNSIDLVACRDGVDGTETLMNSVVYGIFNVLDAMDLINYDNVHQLFYTFGEDIESLYVFDKNLGCDS